MGSLALRATQANLASLEALENPATQVPMAMLANLVNLPFYKPIQFTVLQVTLI